MSLQRISRFMRVYRLPALAILAYIAVAIAWHRGAYLDSLRGFLQDPDWWAENTFSVIVFTVLVSWVVAIASRDRARVERAPYTGWRLEVIDGGETDEAPLFQEEIRGFLESPLKERQFIQSVISSRGCQIDIRRLDILDGAQWVKRDRDERKYVIDMDRFRASRDYRTPEKP